MNSQLWQPQYYDPHFAQQALNLYPQTIQQIDASTGIPLGLHQATKNYVPQPFLATASILPGVAPETATETNSAAGVFLETTSGKRKRSYQHIQDPAERRRIRNRESAKLARLHKKNYVIQLESNLEGLEDKNQTLLAENSALRQNFQRLVNASGLDPVKIQTILGCDYLELLNMTPEKRQKQAFEGVKTPTTPTAVQVKQEYDGSSSVTTLRHDSTGFVRVNKNNDGISGIIPPSPVPLNHLPVQSPSGSSGYNSEHQTSPMASQNHQPQVHMPISGNYFFPESFQNAIPMLTKQSAESHLMNSAVPLKEQVQNLNVYDQALILSGISQDLQ